MTKRIIVILGPTTSGKSNLAVRIARKFNGEIVSADSRQVYKGFDIGSGKVTKNEMMGIPHHLLSVANPKRKFTVAQYRKLALKAIEKIFENGKIPIICGGTGFYIQSIIDGIVIPKVKPDWKLRERLSKKTAEELFIWLRKIDPRRAKTIDPNNKRRLIRALEIVTTTKATVPLLQKKPLPFPALLIGVKKTAPELKRLIQTRLLKRIKQGMINEVERLKESGLSWKRLEELGLEYRYVSKYLQGKINRKEMIEKLQKEIEHFAKRQMTWFSRHWTGSCKAGKRDKEINWVENYQRAETLVKNFLKKIRED